MCNYCEKSEVIQLSSNMAIGIYYNRLSIFDVNKKLIVVETKINYCPFCGKKVLIPNVKLGERRDLWQ